MKTKITFVVNTSLDACAQVDAELSLLVLELVVELRGHVLREEGVVVLQVWALSWHVLGAESGTFLLADVLVSTTSLKYISFWSKTQKIVSKVQNFPS